jgi:hypothetical protein
MKANDSIYIPFLLKFSNSNSFFFFFWDNFLNKDMVENCVWVASWLCQNLRQNNFGYLSFLEDFVLFANSWEDGLENF